MIIIMIKITQVVVVVLNGKVDRLLCDLMRKKGILTERERERETGRLH